MKAAGIICEYNPYHKGHQYLLDNVRADLKPDAIVCVMSGDFMQRGVPALWDKYKRAQMAINQGVDLVLELPSKYAVNGAAQFAKGGIDILNRLGCVKYLGFGSECGNIEILLDAIDVEKQDGFSDRLNEGLDNGLSYPKAYSLAAGNAVFEDPNNVLGIEYLREIRKQNADFKAYTVKRFFGISAERIRQDIHDGKDYNYNYPKLDWSIRADEKLFAMVRYNLVSKSEKEIAEVLEVSEGLENRLKEAVKEAKNLDDLIQKTKSKRFTYAKISRILIQLVLGITKASAKEEVESVKVLALNKNGRKILKQANKEAKINFEVNPDDAKAHDIYNILVGRDLYKFSDYVINAKPVD